jgi:PPP family 3-phenylpropionic acid transporter
MPFILRVTLLYMAIFMATGIQLPFLPIWLAAKGFDDRTIGIVLAMATAARIMVVPFSSRAADRFFNLGTAIAIAIVAGAAAFTLIGLNDRIQTIAAACIFAAAIGGTVLPLVEAYSLDGLAARGHAYGPVRGWGSIAFIVGNLAAGLFAGMVAPAEFIWILIAAYWLGVLPALALPPIGTNRAIATAPAAPKRPLSSIPGLLPVVVASSLIQASHAVFYGFGTLHWKAIGLGSVAIGALWALSVVMEIILFAASARFPPAIGPLPLLAIGGAGAALRWAVMALDPPLAVLPLLQCLHALSFGATHLGAVQFVARSAPAGRTATVQGTLTLANGAGMTVAMAIAGQAYAVLDARAYVIMVLPALAGAAIGVVMIRRRVC